jgi:ATP-dependent DNA helicase RecQ
MNNAKDILKKVFGYDHFRPLQSEVIENILNKKDTLVIMPTGGGKSLCYQIPALIFQGLTIVVSPLISLMNDQVRQLAELGISAIYLNSSMPGDEYGKNVNLVKQGKVKLLYLAPESLLKPGMLEMLSSVRIDCLTIDEAHCISEWGHDFRPEYRKIAEVRARFSGAVCVALTATATSRVREDIKKSLNFESSSEYIGSFDRENLFLSIVLKKDPIEQTIAFLKQHTDQSGIIYCFSRRQVEDLCELLQDEGFSAKPYHAGLSDKDRWDNQDLFIKDDVLIIVATVAFGMGINKPNVRFVIHYDLPKNIETYYQEIGRAGRDGLRSNCMMLLSYGDIQKIRHFINQKEGHEKRVANNHLQALLQFAETDVCRRIGILNYFGEEYPKKNCKMCDNCLSEKKELTDITIHAQKFLSCIKRTGERFGAAHIINVLRGSEEKKVLKFGHQNLSTYGIGQDLSKYQWFNLSRQFLHQGLMVQDMDYGGLQLSPKAWDVFKGKESVLGRLEGDEVKEVKAKRKIEDIDIDHDEKLFEKLRKKRKEIADKSNVPPYIIFSDKTLIEMSSFFPQKTASLKGVYGIGEEKLKKYGFVFLEVICEYCEKHNIEEKHKTNISRRATPTKRTGKLRHIAIGDAYNSGQTIANIMAGYSIKLITVLDHLFKYLLEGNSIRPDGLCSLTTIDKKQQDYVLKSFEKLSPEFLSPVFKAHNGEISYEDLKILRLYYMSCNMSI